MSCFLSKGALIKETKASKISSAPLTTSNGELDEETIRKNRERLFGAKKKKSPVVEK